MHAFVYSIFFWALIAQAPDLDAPPNFEEEGFSPSSDPSPKAPAVDLPNEVPAEKPPETFQDPFSEPSNPNLEPPSGETLPDPRSIPSEPQPFIDSAPAFEGAPPIQTPSLPPAPDFPAPPASDSVVTPSPVPPARTDFAFPDGAGDEGRGPIGQDVIRAAGLEAPTLPGTWHFSAATGGGMNINNRKNQVHLALEGGYRLFEDTDVGMILSYRFIGDKLLGFIGTYERDWRITRPPTTRIHLLYGGGLGWTLQAVDKSQFTQGLFTLRLQSEVLFYPYEKFALVSGAALEVFPFGTTTNGKFKNLFKGKGLPTQLMLSLGVRWEY